MKLFTGIFCQVVLILYLLKQTVRLWDLRTCSQVQRIVCPNEVSDLDINDSTLTLCYGNTVAFGNVET